MQSLAAPLLGSSTALACPARRVRRPSNVRCRTNLVVSEHIGTKHVLSHLKGASGQWRKQAVLFATICPLAYVLPAAAQAASQASGSLADDFTVPLLLSALLGGVVFGTFNDKATKKVLDYQVSGISGTAGAEEPSLALAGSATAPSSAQPVQTELQAAVAEVPASASALLVAAQETTKSAPSQEDRTRSATEAVLAAVAETAADSKGVVGAKAEETATQLEALPVLRAKEIDVAVTDVRDTTAAVPANVAAVATSPEVPVTPAAKVSTNPPAQPATLQQRGEAIFDLAAETARRMQAEYEAKVAAIKAEGERRREEELRRRQQRYAALDRLQAAAASQTAPVTEDPQENSQGPFARLMGLLLALWAWLKERCSSLFTHTSNSSSAASA